LKFRIEHFMAETEDIAAAVGKAAKDNFEFLEVG
jgi:hypothetical protein